MRNREEDEDKKLEAAARASLISKHKEELAKKIIENPEIDDKQKQDGVKFLSDDKQIKDAVDKTVGLKKAPSKPGVADQFKEALTFFAPQLVGGLIAGAVDGTPEGFIAGYNEGANIRDAYSRYKKDIADYALKEKSASKYAPKSKQQSDYVTSDGSPAIFDPNDGKYKTSDGKIVPPQKLYNSINIRQKENLQRSDQRIQLSHDKFANELRKQSQLSDAQVKSVADFDNSLKSVSEIDRLFNDAETGPVIGRVQSLQQLADSSPDVFNKLKAEASAARLAYQKATSGLQVNEREIEMIGSIIPDENDAPSVFKSKLDVFKRIVTAHRDSFMSAIKTGQPLKEDVIKDIEEAASQFELGGAPRVDTARQLEIIRRIKSRRRR